MTALVNDTVGTLVAHAYKDPNTLVGVILGTGTNAAYVEKIENIKKWKGPIPESKKMIVNSEVRYREAQWISGVPLMKNMSFYPLQNMIWN